MENEIQALVTFEFFEHLGLYYDLSEVLELERQGEFPKQVFPGFWDAEQLVAWVQVNTDRLPPRPD